VRTLHDVSTLPDARTADAAVEHRVAQRAWNGEDERLPLPQPLDRSGFLAVYEQHASTVYAYAATRVKVRQDAEEITQDVFVTLWRKRSQLNLDGPSLLPWLIVTCRNLSANRVRAITAVARRSGDPEELQGVPAPDSDSPEVQAELGELQAIIDGAVARLSAMDQAILQACLVEERSYDDVARDLGVSNGSVRNRLSRLRARMRDELQTMRGIQ
jgi:RNA polymerase sigma factor (sigma-70 family)